MSPRELNRATILRLVVEGHLTVTQACQRMQVSLRQARRLLRRFEQSGAAGLTHRLRGRPAARRMSPEQAAHLLELARGRYAGFNDTHLHEALAEREGLRLGRETLRRLLRQAGLAPKRRRRPRQRRDPAPCRGLMIQWDGSLHRWLGSEGPKWALMAAVDDADGRCLAAFFTAAETSAAYLRLLDAVLVRAGIPHSVYQDRHGALRRNDGHWNLAEQLAGEQEPTQVCYALRELGIRPIFAGSPQGKGRIERFFGVAQDRLIAELACLSLTTLEQANDFLQTRWIADFNRRFGRCPAQPGSAFRSLRGVDRHKILCFRYSRVVAADNTVTLGDLVLQLPPGPKRRSWAQARVDVRQHLDGVWSIYYRDLKIGHHPATPLLEPSRVRIQSKHKRTTKGAHQDLLVYFSDDIDPRPPQTPPLPLPSPQPPTLPLPPSHRRRYTLDPDISAGPLTGHFCWAQTPATPLAKNEPLGVYLLMSHISERLRAISGSLRISSYS